MQRNKKLLVLFLMVVLFSFLSLSSSMAAGTTANFKIINNTDKTLTVTLLGPQTYNISSAPGKTIISVEKGNYQYSFYDCGKLFIGDIKVMRTDNWLEIDSCNTSVSAAPASSGAGENMIEITIKNKSPRTLEMYFLGTETYIFSVPPGNHLFNVKRGLYNYSYYDCAVIASGSITVRPNNKEIVLTDCNISTSSDKGTPETYGEVEFTLNNKGTATLEVSLLGPQVYQLTAPSGKSKFIIQRGTYEFFYYACGEIYQGTLKVKRDFSELKFSPCYTSKNGRGMTDHFIKRIKIRNDAREWIVLHLSGPQYYSFSIRPNGANIQIEKGLYQYSYTACGEDFQGAIRFRETDDKLKLPRCSSLDNR